MKHVIKEHVWLACLALGPCIIYSSAFYPAMSIIGLVLVVIGIKGVLVHIW